MQLVPAFVSASFRCTMCMLSGLATSHLLLTSRCYYSPHDPLHSSPRSSLPQKMRCKDKDRQNSSQRSEVMTSKTTGAAAVACAGLAGLEPRIRASHLCLLFIELNGINKHGWCDILRGELFNFQAGLRDLSRQSSRVAQAPKLLSSAALVGELLSSCYRVAIELLSSCYPGGRLRESPRVSPCPGGIDQGRCGIGSSFSLQKSPVPFHVKLELSMPGSPIRSRLATTSAMLLSVLLS